LNKTWTSVSRRLHPIELRCRLLSWAVLTDDLPAALSAPDGLTLAGIGLSIMPAKFVQILRFRAFRRELICELFEPKNVLPDAVERGGVRFYQYLKNR